MNNQSFKVGEKVVALTDPTTPFSQRRKKGEVYTVKAVSYCSTCGKQSINIGPCSNGNIIECIGCRKEAPTNGLAWTDSRHFTHPISISDCIEYRVKVSLPELTELKELQNQ